MSKGYEWGLLHWGNGEVHLTYWDSLHGDDINLILNADGTVERHTYEYPPGTTPDDAGLEVRTPVDLVALLREFALNPPKGE